MMGLIELTLKTKNVFGETAENAMKLLTYNLCTVLPPNSNGKAILSKEEYLYNLHNILYNIHLYHIYTPNRLFLKSVLPQIGFS